MLYARSQFTQISAESHGIAGKHDFANIVNMRKHQISIKIVHAKNIELNLAEEMLAPQKSLCIVKTTQVKLERFHADRTNWSQFGGNFFHS